MILIKSRVIVHAVFALVGAIVKTVYKILKVFHVRFLALMTLLGVIFYYTEVFTNYKKITVCYVIVLVVYFLSLTLKGYRKITKSKKKNTQNGSVKIVSQTQEQEEQSIAVESAIKEEVKYPKYYSVKQNANYVMAEFSDRYELYKKTSTGLSRVRIDYKEQTNDGVL